VWWTQASREVLLGVLGMVAVGLWLFTARTYYYTGVPSMFWGTTASLNSVWQATDGVGAAVERIGSSVLMLITMNDPPRFDLRALPVLAGFGIALLGVCRVACFARLPLNAIVLCLAGVSGALVARGSAYPGRFSIHLVPVTVALAVCAIALFVPQSSARGGDRAASDARVRRSLPAAVGHLRSRLLTIDRE
jgi:hypothetical protein